MAHGDARKGELANGVDSQYSSHYLGTQCIQHYYLSCTTPRLPVVDWTDASADLNGIIRIAERRNLVSVRLPSHFNWPLLHWKFLCLHICYIHKTGSFLGFQRLFNYWNNSLHIMGLELFFVLMWTSLVIQCCCNYSWGENSLTTLTKSLEFRSLILRYITQRMMSFRLKLSTLSSRVKKSWPLKMGPLGCTVAKELPLYAA